MQNLKQFTHTTAAGRTYIIQTYEIECGHLICSQVLHNGQSLPTDGPWAVSNWLTAEAAARRLANGIDAASHR